MKDIIRRNITGQVLKGLCRLQVCYTCHFTICKHFLWPRGIVEENCPQCKAVDWYKEAPSYIEVDKCDCYVQSCENCGHVLCLYMVDSMRSQCPTCAEFDKWVIITNFSQ
jgi:phage FluMu protein Com